MPDAIAPWQNRARAAIAEYLQELPGSRELSRGEVLLYEERRFSYGWEVPFDFSDQLRRFHVLATHDFPFSYPRIALRDRPEFLTWPHVEEDGILCLHSEAASWDLTDPVGVVQTLLRWAVDLVKSSVNGSNRADFFSEFNSYWGFAATDGANRTLSLLTLKNVKDRQVAVWRGTTLDVIGETPEQIKNWLVQRYGRDYKALTEPAALIWIEQMPIPHEYPHNARDVLRIIGKMPQVLQKLINSEPESISTVLASTGPNGNILAGLSIPRPRHKNMTGRKVDLLTKGFRQGRVPPFLLSTRYFCGDNPVSRFEMDRADHNWIHGRDRDADQPMLKGAKVVIAGSGSLGAPLAVSLAQAGVGSISLIDPGPLRWANISRHPLGADDVGKNKAEALAVKLRLRFPHLSFNSSSTTVQEALGRSTEALKNALVINATGNWAALVYIETLIRSLDVGTKSLNTWLERHAAAGHALFALADGPCARCAFDATGVPHSRISEWPDEREIQEPECGALFSPYGAAEVLNSVSMVTDFALDIICGRISSAEQRIWVGPLSKISRLGGNWSTYWQEHSQFREIGGVLVSQVWTQARETCSHSGEEWKL